MDGMEGTETYEMMMRAWERD
ncbi:uncharacterized protein G2W53_038123 [Senna tora]|uniref:Uncharacterized protein n=1 Tax=Senna tora TaxID=362788 RepID=A0A834SLK2_9FABA|nr:uncharacterized protein G2W53_044752 [Senna tora]KAF7805962.1 uncharacterized protein G2W53_038123 [Senna tora]